MNVRNEKEIISPNLIIEENINESFWQHNLNLINSDLEKTINTLIQFRENNFKYYYALANNNDKQTQETQNLISNVFAKVNKAASDIKIVTIIISIVAFTIIGIIVIIIIVRKGKSTTRTVETETNNRTFDTNTRNVNTQNTEIASQASLI